MIAANNIEKMQGQPVLVLGDMIADIYLYGNISRISREAPVLVLEQASEKIVAGGAANVINNIATMGGQVYAVGLVGDDRTAEGLAEILRHNGAHVEGFIHEPGRATISKTRIVAGGRTTVSQQIVRVDREDKRPMGPRQEKELSEYLEKLLPRAKGVVLSDYGSGTITDKLLRQVLEYCSTHHILTIVDSRYDIMRFQQVDYIKQNDAELSSAIGREFATEEDLVQGGCRLVYEMHSKGALITRGEDGMSLFERKAGQDAAVPVDADTHSSQGFDTAYRDAVFHVTHIPVTDKSEVYDVSGAGDTCVAAFILGMAAGIDTVTASRISNEASGIAVRKMGTAVVYAEELRQKFRMQAEAAI